MKKFWKVKVRDLKESLEFLENDKKLQIKADLCLFFEFDNFVVRILYNCFLDPKIVDYIYICYNANNTLWYWETYDKYQELINEKFVYCGVINLRKEKLEKINEKILESKIGFRF